VIEPEIVKAKAWTREACDDWNARFGAGTAPGGRITGGLKHIVDTHGWELVRPAWQRYLARKEPDFVSAQDFAQKLGVWLDRQTSGVVDPKFEASRQAIVGWLKKQEAKGVGDDVS
jgi:hypothetical protein